MSQSHRVTITGSDHRVIVVVTDSQSQSHICHRVTVTGSESQSHSHKVTDDTESQVSQSPRVTVTGSESQSPSYGHRVTYVTESQSQVQSHRDSSGH